MERGDDAVESDVDELERLREADPVGRTDVAALSHSARARAAFTEITMSTTTTPRRRTTLALAGAAVGLVAVIGAVAVLGGGTGTDDPPVVADPGDDTGDPSVQDPDDGVIAPPGMAMCVATYDETTLLDRELAFAGTLRAVDGDTLTFDVEESFRGDLGDEVSLGGAMVLTAITPDNDSPVQVGDRLLVAGDGGFAWGCGFTQPYDETVASSWRDAFGG